MGRFSRVSRSKRKRKRFVRAVLGLSRSSSYDMKWVGISSAF